MRLMEADLREVPIYRPRVVLSDYIGTKVEYTASGTIRAQIQPTADKLSVAVYGNRVERMRNLVCPYGTEISKGDKVELDGVKYKVVGLLAYSSHLTAAVEMEGVEDEH